MKIFITGATGFVGSHLANHLHNLGHQVFSLVRDIKKAQKLPSMGEIIIGSLSYNESPKWINKLPIDLDIVIHTAGIVHSHNTQEFHQINDLATRELYIGLGNKYKTLHFVFISSLASCGPSLNGKQKQEQDKQIPVSEYGRSKYNAEQFLINNMNKNWKLSIIRPPMIIGPRDPAVLDIFKMVKNRAVIYPGLDGKDKNYSFICVFDLVELISKVSFNSKETLTPNVYFSSHPNSISYDQLIKLIQNKMGNKKIIYFGIPSPIINLAGNLITLSSSFFPNNIRLTRDKVNEILPKAWLCNGEKACKEQEMEYLWPIGKTIDITYKYYKENKLL